MSANVWKMSRAVVQKALIRISVCVNVWIRIEIVQEDRCLIKIGAIVYPAQKETALITIFGISIPVTVNVI